MTLSRFGMAGDANRKCCNQKMTNSAAFFRHAAQLAGGHLCHPLGKQTAWVVRMPVIMAQSALQ